MPSSVPTFASNRNEALSKIKQIDKKKGEEERREGRRGKGWGGEEEEGRKGR